MKFCEAFDRLQDTGDLVYIYRDIPENKLEIKRRNIRFIFKEICCCVGNRYCASCVALADVKANDWVVEYLRDNEKTEPLTYNFKI